MVSKRVVKKTKGESIIDFIKKPLVTLGTIAGTILTIATILYYTISIANGASVKYNQIDTIDKKVNSHITEQNTQFQAVECKIDKLSDRVDLKLDKVSDKLYVIAQAVARIEQTTKSKEASIVSGDVIKDINPRDKIEFVSYKPLKINSNKEN